MENLMQSFPVKSWDVTNYLGCIMGCGTRQSLTLEAEEAVLHTHNCLCRSVQRRPYAQLGSVDEVSTCFNVCVGVSTDLMPVDPETQQRTPLLPQCGCSQALVRELIQELNARKDGRGNIAQIRQQTCMLDTLNKLKVQIPVMMDHFNVAYPPDAATAQRLFGDSPPEFRTAADILGVAHATVEFDTKEFDVTCCMDPLCCTRKTLTLGPDEAVFTRVSGPTQDRVIEKRPYAQIDSVNAEKSCGCISVLQAGELTGGQPFMPGSGCDAGRVEEIRRELQERVTARGNTGQIQKLETMSRNIYDFGAQLPLLLDKLGAEVAYPPPQETMDAIFGPGAPEVPGASAEAYARTSERFATKEYDVTNNCVVLVMCLCTCGIAGCTKVTMVMDDEEIVTKMQNNCMDSVDRMPYAMLGHVNEYTSCCCCRGVNNILPGWGCSPDLVSELAAELQARKVGRGNIAQLRNQENTMYKALEVDVRTDIVLNSLGIPYPPTQETMTSLYGSTPPTLPTDESTRGSGIHMGASNKFDTQHFNVTNYCTMCCSCGMTQQLELDDEEMVILTFHPCGNARSRVPYAHMGSVEKAELCCGLRSVETDVGTFMPGCGCNAPLVDRLRDALQDRKVGRGNIAQIRQQENLMIELIKLGVKLDLISHQRRLSYPPTQETMQRIFGPDAQVPELAEHVIAARRRSGRASTMVDVRVPDGLRPGDTFRVRGPRGSFDVTVPDGFVGGQRLEADVPAAAPRQVEMTPLVT